MPIMLRRAWFWGPHYEIEKPHLFHFVFLVNHNRIVMWELGAKGYIPKTDAWCEHAFTQVMSPRIRLHLEFTPNDRQPRIRLMKPHGNFPIQYLQHTICRKNAAQQARRNPGDPRSRPWGWSATSFNFGSATYMHKQLQQYFQSTPHMHFQQHLLYCPAYHGLNIYCPAPRIAGYQSPFPFVCASWTGV